MNTDILLSGLLIAAIVIATVPSYVAGRVSARVNPDADSPGMRRLRAPGMSSELYLDTRPKSADDRFACHVTCLLAGVTGAGMAIVAMILATMHQTSWAWGLVVLAVALFVASVAYFGVSFGLGKVPGAAMFYRAGLTLLTLGSVLGVIAIVLLIL